MKRHNFDKLAVYPERGTTWYMVYAVGIVNVYLIYTLYRLLTSGLDPAIAAEFSRFLQGGKAGFSVPYFFFGILDVAAAVAAAILLPGVNKKSYTAFWVHMGASLAAYPLTMLVSKILGAEVPVKYTPLHTIFYIVWLVFAVLNMVYFAKRRELFETDIFHLVTGEAKDETKH